jgi:MOSC domain-containing protein YiiM
MQELINHIRGTHQRIGAHSWSSSNSHRHAGIHRRSTLTNSPILQLTNSRGIVWVEDPAVKHLTMEELEAGLEEIRRAPKDRGVLELIVRRPRKGAREVIEEGELDLRDGLVGDSWKHRRSSRTPDGQAHPDTQINVMSARVIALVSQGKERWPLAGDQLFVDLDLSVDNVPPGTQLAIGAAVIEATSEPHTGCGQFVERFGLDATKFVNSPIGRQLQLRGINARVVQPGTIRVGDVARKLPVAGHVGMGG